MVFLSRGAKSKDQAIIEHASWAISDDELLDSLRFFPRWKGSRSRGGRMSEGGSIAGLHRVRKRWKEEEEKA